MLLHKYMNVAKEIVRANAEIKVMLIYLIMLFIWWHLIYYIKFTIEQVKFVDRKFCDQLTNCTFTEIVV